MPEWPIWGVQHNHVMFFVTRFFAITVTKAGEKIAWKNITVCFETL